MMARRDRTRDFNVGVVLLDTIHIYVCGFNRPPTGMIGFEIEKYNTYIFSFSIYRFLTLSPLILEQWRNSPVWKTKHDCDRRSHTGKNVVIRNAKCGVPSGRF